MRGRRTHTLTRWKIRLAQLFDVFPLLYAGGNEVRPVATVRRQVRAFDRALSLAARHVALGLATPTVCVSFGGELDELHANPSFEALRVECRRRRTELITSVMSMTGSARLGPGALAVSFASTHFTL